MPHNDDFDSSVKPDAKKRADFQEAIDRWVADHRNKWAIMPNEIAHMGSIERLLAFKQDDIFFAAAYLREHPKADAAPFVRQVIKWCCDLGNGHCTLSEPRLARLFSRNQSTISDCLNRLVDDQLVMRERVSGKETRYWPVMSRSFLENSFPLTWFLDHWAPPTRRGRPRKDGNVIHAFDKTGRDALPGNPADISENPGGHAPGVLEKPQGENEKTPGDDFAEFVAQQGETPCDSTKESTGGGGGDDSAVRADARAGRSSTSASPVEQEAEHAARSATGRQRPAKTDRRKGLGEGSPDLPPYVTLRDREVLRAAYEEWSTNGRAVSQDEADYVLAQAIRSCVECAISETLIRQVLGETIASGFGKRGKGDIQAGFPNWLAKALRRNARTALAAEEINEQRRLQGIATAAHNGESDRRRYNQRGDLFEAHAARRDRHRQLNPLTVEEICDTAQDYWPDWDDNNDRVLYGFVAPVLRHYVNDPSFLRASRVDWAATCCGYLRDLSDDELDELALEMRLVGLGLQPPHNIYEAGKRIFRMRVQRTAADCHPAPLAEAAPKN